MKKTAGPAEATARRKRAGGSGEKECSAPALEKKCGDYFAQCEEKGRNPTWQGLAGHLGVTSGTLTRWLRDEADGKRREALQKAADSISDRLQQRTDTMATLSMRQPIFGGFADRAGSGGEGQVKIIVTVSGCGEKEAEEFGK